VTISEIFFLLTLHPYLRRLFTIYEMKRFEKYNKYLIIFIQIKDLPEPFSRVLFSTHLYIFSFLLFMLV